jgi:hypothetical protein
MMKFWNSRKAQMQEPTAPTQIELINAKLAECLAAQEGAKAEVDRVSLAAVLGADEAAGIAAVGNLTALQARETLLRSALREAELEQQRDRERLTQREHDARRRSLAQRVAKANRSAKDVQLAIQTLVKAQAELDADMSNVVSVLPGPMRTTNEPWETILSAQEMQRMSLVEGYRMARTGPLPHLFPRPPGAGAAESPHDHFTIPPLTTRVGDLLAQCKNRFETFGPKPTIPPTTISGASAPVVVSAPASGEDAVLTTGVSLPEAVLPPEADETLRAAMKREVEADLDEARREGLA